MKRLAFLTAIAALAALAPGAAARSATNKTTFDVIAIEGISATGQVVATRGKKPTPDWFSLSVKVVGAPAVNNNGTTEATEEMPDPTVDDTPYEYCLYGGTIGDDWPELDRSTVNGDGTLVLDYGTHGPLPQAVGLALCADRTLFAMSTSEIVAPSSSARLAK